MNAVLPCATETEGFARNGRIGGAEAVRDFANALGPDGPARRYRECGRLFWPPAMPRGLRVSSFPHLVAST